MAESINFVKVLGGKEVSQYIAVLAGNCPACVPWGRARVLRPPQVEE